MNNEHSQNAKSTARVEALSDGIFAVAITLLVLDLKVPDIDALPSGGLLPALLSQWPTYIAYVISFVSILIMWVNHHILFKHIRRSDAALLLINGLLLMGIAVVAFPTSLVSHYIQSPDGVVATAVYAFVFLWIAVMWNVIWRYASYNNRLIDKNTAPETVKAANSTYLWSLVLYFAAFILAFVNVYASLGLCALLAGYYAVMPVVRWVAPE